MLRIKFYVVLFVMCLWVSGCTGIGASDGDAQTALIPSNVSAVQLLRTLGRGEISQIALSSDGKYLAVASSLGIWLYDAVPILTTMRIEPPTPRLLAGHVGDVTTVVFNPDSTRLASGGEDSTVRIWDVVTGNLIGAPMSHEGRVSGVAFSPNGALIASSSDDNSVRLWDISQAALDGGTFGRAVGEPLRQDNQMTSVAFSPTMNDDTLILAAGSTDPIIRVWALDMNGAAQDDSPTVLRGFTGSVLSVAFSPDGTLLASGHQDINGIDNNVHLWDMTTREETGVLEGHRDGVQSVGFSPNGRMVVSASSDSTVRLWNVNTQNYILEMDDHAAVVSSAVISPDNTMLLSAGNDGKVRIWDISMGGPLNQLSGFGSNIISIAFSPDGTLIAAGTNDNAVHLWDVDSGNEVATLRGHRSAILAVVFNPDGTQLASGSRDRTILLWDISSALELGELLPCDQTSIYRGLTALAQQNHPCNGVRQLTGHNNDVRSLAFSADGYLLASGGCAQIAVRQCQQGEVRLWDVDMPGEISLMLEHNNWVESVAFSPDGSRLASGSRDETINIWDVETGLLSTTLYGQQGWVESVAFSHDGFLLASGGGDENVLIWNLVNPDDLPKVLVGHTESVTDIVFSPNGRLIASAGLDDHVRVWDVRSGILLGDLVGHIGDVNSVSFREDGGVFASGGADGTIRLWGIP